MNKNHLPILFNILESIPTAQKGRTQVGTNYDNALTIQINSTNIVRESIFKSAFCKFVSNSKFHNVGSLSINSIVDMLSSTDLINRPSISIDYNNRFLVNSRTAFLVSNNIGGRVEISGISKLKPNVSLDMVLNNKLSGQSNLNIVPGILFNLDTQFSSNSKTILNIGLNLVENSQILTSSVLNNSPRINIVSTNSFLSTSKIVNQSSIIMLSSLVLDGNLQFIAIGSTDSIIDVTIKLLLVSRVIAQSIIEHQSNVKINSSSNLSPSASIEYSNGAVFGTNSIFNNSPRLLLDSQPTVLIQGRFIPTGAISSIVTNTIVLNNSSALIPAAKLLIGSRAQLGSKSRVNLFSSMNLAGFALFHSNSAVALTPADVFGYSDLHNFFLALGNNQDIYLTLYNDLDFINKVSVNSTNNINNDQLIDIILNSNNNLHFNLVILRPEFDLSQSTNTTKTLNKDGVEKDLYKSNYDTILSKG